jgi:hypothetical protein
MKNNCSYGAAEALCIASHWSIVSTTKIPIKGQELSQKRRLLRSVEANTARSLKEYTLVNRLSMQQITLLVLYHL